MTSKSIPTTRPDAKPVVFGPQPDTRLQVFGRHFHVYSTILKLHSTFFRKFLDSPDKTAAKSGALFQYDWVTKVDEDGSWGLICSTNQTLNNDSWEKLKGTQEAAETVFEKLLLAMHCRPYQITSGDELQELITLADYYRALLTLSNSISGALLESPEFLLELPKLAVELLPAVAKLRNPILFRECLMHTLGPLQGPRFRQIEDQKLHRTAERAYNQMGAKAMGVQAGLIAISTGRQWGRDGDGHIPALQSAMFSAAKFAMRDTLPPMLTLPLYFRILAQINEIGGSEIRRKLEIVLKNNLKLNRTSAMAGMGEYEDFLFCADIDDADLPWDRTQTNW